MMTSDLHTKIISHKFRICRVMVLAVTSLITFTLLSSCNYKDRNFFTLPTDSSTPNNDIDLFAPTLMYPPNGTSGIGTDVMFEWSSVDMASFYELQVAENGQGFDNSQNFSSSSNMFEFDQFELQTSYSWRVRAAYDDLRSPWSDTWNFMTMDPPKLSAPKLVAPEDKADNIEIPVQFKWNPVDGATFGYRFQLSTGDTFEEDLVVDEDVDNTEIEVPGLQYNMYYGWRVRANGGSERSDPLESDWSEVRGFTTKAETPSSIELDSPTICVEHGSNQSEIFWLWFFSNTFGIDIEFTLRVIRPNGSVEEIAAVSPDNAVRLLFLLDIFTFGNYQWEIISVKNLSNGQEINFTGNTNGVVNVGSQQQNPGSCE